MPINTSVRLKQRPTGMPSPETWEIRKEETRTPADGEVLVKVEYMSLDPAMRGWLNEGKSYIDPVGIGDVMRAGAVGEIVESRDPQFKPGDKVAGGFGIQSYWTGPAKGLPKVDASLAPLPRWLGVLGMPGMTAYFGILDVGALKDGETVVVSAASGAVGALVGQIAKLKGCKVVGIAGGPDKCRYVTQELGFDACIDYKNDNVAQKLKEYIPEGLDVYFDNVGGDILEACMNRLKRGARIVICGAIAGYNDSSKIQGPRNYLNLLVSRARMEGFVVFDYASRYGEAVRDIAGWLADGKIKAKEHIEEGIERFPEVLPMLFRGENFGKLILKA